ncbi:MAG: head-tail connector protein [Selenomonadaceae bacterium]
MKLEDIKLYLRVDGADEDALISSLQTAAIQYLQETTGKTYDAANELQNMLIKLLVAHWYENRVANDGGSTEVPHSITALMIHISLTGAS